MSKTQSQVLHRNDVIIIDDGRPTEDFHLFLEDLADGVNTVFAESFDVVDLPAANSANAGVNVFVPDEVGGATMAFSDGTNWLRYRDSTIVS